MASGSNNFVRNNEATSNYNELAANSSLTPTATEFVPNSANKSKFLKKPKNSKSFTQGYRSYPREHTREQTYPVSGFSEPAAERYNSSGKNRNANVSGSEGNDFAPVDVPDRSTNVSNGGSSRMFAKSSGSSKYNNGYRGYNKGRKELGQSSLNHFPDSGELEEAVGGNNAKPYFMRDNVSGYSKSRDRNGNRDQAADQCSDQQFYNDRSKFREGRDQGPTRIQKRDDSNRGKDRSRFWDRNNYMDREAGDDSRSSDRYPAHYSERAQDHYQDRYRSNRRYTDRNQDRPSDDRNRNQSYDHESRSYSYGSRGRFQYDFMKEDQNRPRNTSYSKGKNTMHNFNTQETFNSDNSKQLSSENPFMEREISNSSRRENGDDVSQRERLTEQLTRGVLECLVCCDRVRQHDAVWSCSNCFHVLHLRCVTKWAKSSKAESGWRCPACQNVTETLPSQYRCFCSKVVDPQWNRHDTPHTCGEVCGKSREGQRPQCVHKCTLLCHPGPCPPCVAQVMRNCGCGKTSQTVKCALEKPLLCEAVCRKVLNCGVHLCEKTCHSGSCEPCSLKVKQVCFCKKESREVDCLAENQGILQFSCNGICEHDLACGNHKCNDKCHEGNCKPCQLTPAVITHCPCGKTELSTNIEELRKSCLDPIPTCGKICSKRLPCGQPSNPHTCKSSCHAGMCPPCLLTTMVRCRCGHMDRELPCEQLTSKADDARCEKKCTKKRSCAKHKCNQQCCIEIDHPCPLPCNHTLSCGLHRCEQLCHRGHCQPCWRTSFEELFCECGAEVLYPPVPCGTKPPPCSRPCSRQHDCEHPALHPCHSDTNCPPCTVLTQKYCYGNHELRKSIPCHQKEFSCGLPCNKELPCGRHKCIQLCHKEECLRPGAVCTQPCTVPRPTCQHPCSAPCHEGSCPDVPCKETVRVTCECGHRSAMRPCSENTKEYQRIATSLLASKMADVQLGHSIDIGDIMGNASTKKLYLKSLECNDECKAIERNRKMAIGLQIRNPDISQKLTPRYSDFMRGWAKKDPLFCQHIHDKLTELVKLAKESKQRSRSHSFEVMNREKRQFVHEYCEHFGCESIAYDQEPKRNVVATAQKIKAWLPSVGLLELVQREAGQRKVPGPMLNSVKKPSNRNMDTLSSKWATKSTADRPSSASLNQAFAPTSNVSNNSTYPSLQGDEPVSGSSSGISFIDHFNS
ncbi:Protein shuttle craft [Frankliniella fusca]|uniref:Protein shuttle craft n=1 Tax=Frankliniella fusca TaxID=407009 RepID=A0AAE1LWL6_9NEOP|nr:Protein shuttle craft [Frankliniella fusca]